jgi:hypothetical protein
MAVTLNASNSGTGGLSVTSDATGNLALQTAGTTAIAVDTSQNVGIGTTSPTSGKLVISGNSVTTSQGIRLVGDTADARFICESATLGAGILGTFSNHSQLFYTNSTERMRLNTTGALVLAGGSTSANGIGITFPATQSASSDANTLDDYEEGTFTPILADNASSGNAATMSVQEGFYTKIGNTVTIQIQIVWSSKGSMGSGNNVRIYGIPFNSRTNTSQYYWPALISMSSGNTGFIAGQEGGGTAVTLELVNSPISELSTSYVSTSGRLLIQYTYRTP